MKIQAYTATRKAQWDSFLDKNTYAWLCHSYDYIKWVSEDLPAPASQHLSFCIVDSEEVLAICPLYLNIEGYQKPLLAGLIKLHRELRSLSSECAHP